MYVCGRLLEDYYQIIGGNQPSSHLLSLIILVGTQNASHNKKLKTDFTTSLAGVRAPQRLVWWLRYYPWYPVLISPHWMSSRRTPSLNMIQTNEWDWLKNPQCTLFQTDCFVSELALCREIYKTSDKQMWPGVMTLMMGWSLYFLLILSQDRCGKFVKCNYCDNECHNWGPQTEMSYNQMTQRHNLMTKSRDKNILISFLLTESKVLQKHAKAAMIMTPFSVC